MTKKQIRKTAFYIELHRGIIYLRNKEFQIAFYHFENAHIIGQQHVFRHTLSHYWMLIYGFKTNNFKEVIGQTFRIVASLLLTLFWVPRGNTGGSNISPTRPIPIRKELKKYF